MSPDERLALVRLKIERADKHIDDLKMVVRTFFDSIPCKVSHKRDPDTRKLIYYVESAQSLPIVVAAIAGDALHCLRDALDQQLYLVGTGNAKGYRDQTSFLISKNAKDFKSSLPGKVQDMRKDHNIDKHRLILTVGSAFRSVDLGAHVMAHMEKALGKALPAINLFFKPADNLFPLEADKELFIDAVDAEPNDKMEFRFDVAIHEPGLIEGQPVVETVVTFRDRISDIVNAFKPCLA
jgi:hypothetical protein